MNSPIQKKIEVFFSYSHIDEKLRDKLAEHLSLLKRQGIISEWHDRKITGGSNINDEISENLNNANIILLLVSSSFLASDYCYEKEMARALERHNAGEARVIPVILRPCDWHGAPFGGLLAFPKDGLPVTKWENEDEAFLDIAKGIRRVAEELQTPKSQQQTDESEKKKLKVKVELPPLAVSFVPRHDRQGQDLIEKVEESLVEWENRTVVLWGYGGVGKTTLATQIARLSENEKQIIWISAENRTEISVGVLLDEIATQLGQHEIRQLPPSLKHEQILSILSETPSLIILDNFETLKPEYQTECLNFLKTREFESLITTRERLDGVKNINVFEMYESEANSFLDRLIEDSTFPDAFTAEIRQKTIETAERNPLVIEWIVGQINAAESPREVFEELQHGEGDAAERVFDRSFNLPQLGNDGRSILLGLSLFVQSARRKSVRDAVGISDNRKFNDALKRLANLRLINVTEASQRIFLGGLTRQFAQAYLENKDNYKSYYQRFVRYFENFAKAHGKPTPDDLNLLEEEKVNIFSSIDLAFKLKNWQPAFSISNNLSEFLYIRGHWEDSIRNNKRVLDLARELDDKRRISDFSYNLGITYYSQGEIEKAEQLLNESLEIRRKLGDQSGIAASLNSLANLASDKGEIEKAEQLYNESLEIYKKLKNQSGIATLLGNLANLASDKGEIEKAEQLYNESLEIYKKLKNQSGIATLLGNLANLAKDKGEIQKAEQLYNESLEIRRKLGDQLGIAASLNSLAILAKDKGEIQKAEQLYNESLEIRRKLGDQSGIAASLHNLAILASDKGEIEKAEQLYNESLEIDRKLGNQSGIAISLNSLANLASDKGEIEKAEQLLNESLEIYRKLGNQSGIATSLNSLAILAKDKGEIEKAEQLYNESLEIRRKLGDQSGIAASLNSLAILAKDKGEIEKAEQLLNESLEIRRKLGDQLGIALLFNSYGEFYFFNGNVDDSEKYCRESLEICKRLEYAEAINENRRLLGQIFQSKGDLETAEDYYQECLDSFRKLSYQKQIALTLKEFASLAEGKDEEPRAIDFLKEALQIFEKLGSPKANEVRSNLERLENTLPKEN